LLVATTQRLRQRTIESTLPTPTTVCPSVTLQPLIVAGLVSGVGVDFRWSPKVPHAGFWLTVECLFVDGGSVNRRREIRALQRFRDRIPTGLTNDCVVNLKAIAFLTFEHAVLR